MTLNRVKLPARLRRAIQSPSPALQAIIACLLAIGAWPYTPSAQIGVDPSWQAVLQIAGAHGFHFGRDLVFTYGPLGFLAVPTPTYGLGSAVAFVASTAVYACLAWAALRSAMRVAPAWLAVIAAFIVVRFAVALPPFETLQALVFVACVELLARPAGRRWPAVVAVAGAAAGASLLGKVNVGIFVALMLLIAAVAYGRSRWAAAALFAAAVVVALVGGWLITGGSLGDLPLYASWSADLIRGYAEGMIVDTLASVRWAYVAFAGCAAILAWLAWRTSTGWPRSRRIALLAVLAVLVFAEWKTAFSRNFVAYALTTFFVAVLPFASRFATGSEPEPAKASAGRPDVGRPDVGRRLGFEAASLAFAAVGMAALAGAHLGPLQLVDPYHPARQWLASAIAFVVPGRLDRAVADTRSEIRSLLDIPPSFLGQIGDRTVEIEPWDTIAAAAYPDLRWQPMLLFQTYTVLTTQADEANAAAIRSPGGPQRILRQRIDDTDGQPRAVDHRFAWWESPAAMIESVCRYDELAANDRWQVLGRTGRTCGPAESLGSVAAPAGARVAVPVDNRPDRLTLVKIHGLEPSPFERVISALHRAGEWYVDLGPDRGVLRLVPGTAPDGLLLSVPSSIRYSPRFAFGPPITSIAVSAGSFSARSRELTYEFVSIPLQPTAGGG